MSLQDEFIGPKRRAAACSCAQRERERESVCKIVVVREKSQGERFVKKKRQSVEGERETMLGRFNARQVGYKRQKAGPQL